MKCVASQGCYDVTVNPHFDATMGRYCCLCNHMTIQWVGDIATVQGGTGVQLYHKALTNYIFSTKRMENTG